MFPTIAITWLNDTANSVNSVYMEIKHLNLITKSNNFTYLPLFERYNNTKYILRTNG